MSTANSADRLFAHRHTHTRAALWLHSNVQKEIIHADLLLTAESLLTSLPGKIGFAIGFYYVLPRFLSTFPQQSQFFAKYMVFVIGALIMSAAGCVISIVCTKNEERMEQASPAVVVCNNQSNMDMFVIGSVYPTHCSIMAKKELIYVPVLARL